MRGGTHAEKVRDVRSGGVLSGVDEAPAFFINGRILSGALPSIQFLPRQASSAVTRPQVRPPLEGGRRCIVRAATGLLALRFISEMKCPVTIHEFSIADDGWAASHCQIGGPEAAIDALAWEKLIKPMMLNSVRNSKSARTAPTPADGKVERIVIGWI